MTRHELILATGSGHGGFLYVTLAFMALAVIALVVKLTLDSRKK
jgi:hypothetical protein